MKVGWWLAWVGVLFSVSSAAEAQHPAAEASPSCFPSCREGYVCSPAGSCVSRCNPPCAAGETCLPDGECQRPAPPAPAPPPPLAPPAVVTPAVVPQAPPASAPKRADNPAAPDRQGRFVFGLRVGVKPAGGGDVKRTETCSPAGTVDCSGRTATTSTSVDDTSPILIAVEGLVHVTQALRLGVGYGLVPYASLKYSGASDSQHIGSEHHLVGIVEGVIPVSPNVGLTLRFQGGASMLQVGGDLADAQRAAVDSCEQAHCLADKGPYFGANYAFMAGILAGQKLRFRGDLALERFSHQLASTNTTLATGTLLHGESQLYGTRFWILAGFEL